MVKRHRGGSGRRDGSGGGGSDGGGGGGRDGGGEEHGTDRDGCAGYSGSGGGLKECGGSSEASGVGTRGVAQSSTCGSSSGCIDSCGGGVIHVGCGGKSSGENGDDADGCCRGGTGNASTFAVAQSVVVRRGTTGANTLRVTRRRPLPALRARLRKLLRSHAIVHVCGLGAALANAVLLAAEAVAESNGGLQACWKHSVIVDADAQSC
eukprot:5094383-Pleurochrysis_carterae.AAC.1